MKWLEIYCFYNIYCTFAHFSEVVLLKSTSNYEKPVSLNHLSKSYVYFGKQKSTKFYRKALGSKQSEYRSPQQNTILLHVGTSKAKRYS